MIDDVVDVVKCLLVFVVVVCCGVLWFVVVC